MLMQDFAAGLDYKDLPEDVLQVLRRSLLDTLGVAAIGSRSKMAQIGTKAARMMFGATTESSARCLFDGNNASAAGAAMAGAMAIDSVDAHDGTSPCKGHAGSAIFPALFAMVDNRTMTGQDLATYLALAYEISYRAGLTQHDTCADYHTSGAWTAVGVAAMTARILGCSPRQIHEAAGIGEYHGPRSQMMRCIDHGPRWRRLGRTDGRYGWIFGSERLYRRAGTHLPGPTLAGTGTEMEVGFRHPLQTLSLLPLVTPKHRCRG